MPDDETAAQSALSGWSSDESDDTDEVEESNSGQTDGSQTERDTDHSQRGRSVFASASISDDAALTDYSCPWCLHPAEEFRLKYADDCIGEPLRNPQVSCPNCSAVIPVEEDWYQDGEKICF